MSKRLSRPQSQAQTRQRLIESATLLYLRDGYAVTSNDQVAEHAGYSRGAVYSNFASKEELALAVLDQHDAEIARQGRAVLDQDTLADRLEKFRQWTEHSLGNSSWTLLRVELALAARRSVALREQLATRNEAALAVAAQAVERVSSELNIPVPVDVRDIARMMMAIGNGTALDSIDDAESTTAWVGRMLAAAQPALSFLTAGASSPPAR